MTRSPLILVAFLGLAACSPASTAFLTGASLVSLAYTDKTLGDQAMSYAYKEDCSILYLADNKPYCQKIETEADRYKELATLAASRYCYRTLGGVSCYDRPDYMASNQTRLNYAFGNLPPEEPRGQIVESPAAALPEDGTY
jgi:hypothetical protein